MTLTPSPRVSVAAAYRDELLQFAKEVAVEAGRATLPFFRVQMAIENKHDGSGFDPVTEADRAAEQRLRERLAERYPEHGVFGEEYGLQTGNGLTWVVDPIDGTRAFMSGMVHWGLLLGLFDGERPILGVMYQPFTDELFFGDGESAGYRRGDREQPIHTRDCGDLSNAVLTTTSPNLFAAGAERAGFDALEAAVKLTRYGGDCYIYAMLAMGHVDLASDGGLNAYDIQGLIPIIEGAGGLVTTVQGASAAMGGTVLAAGTPALHAQALRVLQG